MPNKRTGKEIKCITCGKLVYITRFRLKLNAKYCSVKCFHKNNEPWNKGITKKDDKRLQSISNKARAQMKREYEDGTRDKFKITKKANDALRKRTEVRFKKSPKRMIGKRGYLLIYVPKNGWIKEHHYIWLKAGRKIPNGYQLHHINENKLDNRLENLKLMTNSEHGKLHYKNRTIDELGRFTKE